jgi:sterol desaturase/sphingolipid hydroxylase (fatty acid hydroxylase superfamily)
LDPLLALEPVLRLAAFALVFAAVAAAEALAPWRPGVLGRLRRWPGNLGVLLVAAALARVVLPVTVVGAAMIARAEGWGLFNLLAVPGWVAVPLAVLLLDLAIYAQHVVFHHVPALWRLHRMHHADTEFDATTGLRFHPLEILLSLGIKIAVVVALGAPAVAVLIFEILLNASSVFSHGNIALPRMVDAPLRGVLVTPDMHRVHHSVVRAETDSNYGFCLSWWDRLFGTYREAPEAGRDGVTIGLPAFRDPGEQRLDRLLTQPFRNPGARAVAGTVRGGDAPVA